jgi:RNA polymerase sigma factor (sigma-70 family)
MPHRVGASVWGVAGPTHANTAVTDTDAGPPLAGDAAVSNRVRRGNLRSQDQRPPPSAAVEAVIGAQDATPQRRRTRPEGTRAAPWVLPSPSSVTFGAARRVVSVRVQCMHGYGARDEELVALAKDGEREAFDALFGRYLAMVRGEARRCGLRASEGDVVQESFLRAYLSLPTLDNPAKFASWLRVIAHRVCLTELRSRERTVPLTPEIARRAAAPAQPDDLWHLLASLPPDDREPLHLHYVLGLDTRAAAKAMGITRGAFRMRLYRARKRARALAKEPESRRESP